LSLGATNGREILALREAGGCQWQHCSLDTALAYLDEVLISVSLSLATRYSLSTFRRRFIAPSLSCNSIRSLPCADSRQLVHPLKVGCNFVRRALNIPFLVASISGARKASVLLFAKTSALINPGSFMRVSTATPMRCSLPGRGWFESTGDPHNWSCHIAH